MILFLAHWFVRFSILSGKSGEQRENKEGKGPNSKIVVKNHTETSHGWEEREISEENLAEQEREPQVKGAKRKIITFLG